MIEHAWKRCRICGTTDKPETGDDGAPVTVCYRCAEWANQLVHAAPFRIMAHPNRPGMYRPEAVAVLDAAYIESGQ